MDAQTVVGVIVSLSGGVDLTAMATVKSVVQSMAGDDVSVGSRMADYVSCAADCGGDQGMGATIPLQWTQSRDEPDTGSTLLFQGW